MLTPRPTKPDPIEESPEEHMLRAVCHSAGAEIDDRVTCPDCGGAGRYPTFASPIHTCTTCQGSGWTTETVLDQMRRMSAS